MGPAAEQIIAGVVLSERLAITMYGAIHRAQWNGQRNLRALVVDPKMLEEKGFRDALTDTAGIQTAITLAHVHVVPTAAVESEGPDVVVVTRGGGRYVTVQDLMSAARTSRGAGKLPTHVAGAIIKPVVEALAAAHRAGIVHGAVHPRSVLVDEDGEVRLTDWVVGRALTTAVAQGADSSLWRGLAGYIAPELVVGEDPTPGSDVFAVGAMLFTMLAGESPPGSLRATPAVERLVSRALDTDTSRRYANAPQLLENLLEAFEDDRWDLAERGELIKAAGLADSDTNIDEATEDLLASLGSTAGEVQTPIRPSVDLRAEAAAAAARANGKSATQVAAGKRLDALLGSLAEETLDEPTSFTNVDRDPFKADPISELIKVDPRAREAIVQPGVKSSPAGAGRRTTYDGDELDEVTPLPLPAVRDSDPQLPRRSRSQDEADALSVLAGLDEPMRRVATAADAASAAAAKLEAAAARAEIAAARVQTGDKLRPPVDDSGIVVSQAPPPAASQPAAPRRVVPIVDPIDPAPPPDVNLRGPGHYIVGFVALAAVAGGGYALYRIYQGQSASMAEAKRQHDDDQRKADERAKQLTAGLADPGTIEIHSAPSEAGVWLRLGPTKLTTAVQLSASQTHELALILPSYDLAEVQVAGPDWTGDKAATDRNAAVKATLVPHDASKKPPAPTELPMQPTAENKPTGVTGGGTLTVESTPPGADAWLYIGHTDEARLAGITSGRPYELMVVKDGFQPARLAISADDWRDRDPNTPIDSARKKATIERTVDLVPLPRKGAK